MKKLITFIVAGLFTTVSFAQDTKTQDKTYQQEKSYQKDASAATHSKKHECYMMKDGVVFHCMGEKSEAPKTDVKLSNGTVISTNGMVTMKDGNTKKLENGQCVSMMGSIGDCGVMHSSTVHPKKAETEIKKEEVK